jgi:hypothetical protein
MEIGAPGVDVEKVMAEIRAAVDEKRRKGFYNDPRLAWAERTNLLRTDSPDDLLRDYLDSLAEAVCVDINDFPIRERRGPLARPLVWLKTLIWKVLRFYTYRLWSQQNQVNALLLSALETLERRHDEKIRQLETRLARLESGRPPSP